LKVEALTRYLPVRMLPLMPWRNWPLVRFSESQNHDSIVPADLVGFDCLRSRCVCDFVGACGVCDFGACGAAMNEESFDDLDVADMLWQASWLFASGRTKDEGALLVLVLYENNRDHEAWARA
jgi:hypothetical protein